MILKQNLPKKPFLEILIQKRTILKAIVPILIKSSPAAATRMLSLTQNYLKHYHGYFVSTELVDYLRLILVGKYDGTIEIGKHKLASLLYLYSLLEHVDQSFPKLRV